MNIQRGLAAIVAGAFILCTFLFHLASTGIIDARWIILPLSLQGGVLGSFLARRLDTAARIACTVAGAASIAGLAAWLPMADAMAWAECLYLGVYSALLAVFAGSLARNRVPVVTRIALLVRGWLPPELMGYTRNVTIMWCLFFLAQMIVSLLLFRFAPLQVWSAFVSLVNAPLILAVFACEYAYRLTRYRHYRHDSLADMARLWRRRGA